MSGESSTRVQTALEATPHAELLRRAYQFACQAREAAVAAQKELAAMGSDPHLAEVARDAVQEITLLHGMLSVALDRLEANAL